MLVGLRDTIREQAAHGVLAGNGAEYNAASNGEPMPWDDERILRQWEKVREAWDDDFAAYLRYVGYN